MRPARWLRRRSLQSPSATVAGVATTTGGEGGETGAETQPARRRTGSASLKSMRAPAKGCVSGRVVIGIRSSRF